MVTSGGSCFIILELYRIALLCRGREGGHKQWEGGGWEIVPELQHEQPTDTRGESTDARFRGQTEVVLSDAEVVLRWWCAGVEVMLR